LEIKKTDELSKFLSANNKALVLFFASWCPYSRSFRSIFEGEVAKLKDCGVVIAVVDEDDNPLWDKCEVERVPTVVYFRNGKIAKRLVETPGEGLSRQEFLNFLKGLG
jgi:thiol-disulfide isomerase/thioredoxin